MKLKDVHRIVKKWLYLRSMNRVDLILAVHLSRQLKGTKLWIIFIGGSGATKSELLRALDDEEQTTYILQDMTPNTLVSGNPNAPDLAPKLDNKTVLVLDMAILLNLKKDDKAKVWAQLRELYDGNARKITGTGKNTAYKNLNVTLIACSTPVIDNQVLIHSELGTRELLYRIDPVMEGQEEDKLMQQVLKNELHEEQMRKEIHDAYQKFLSNLTVEKINIKPEIMKKIKDHVRYLRIMRTAASHDSQTGDLISTAHSEAPTRVLKQFKRLYEMLKNLDPDYPDVKALEIIKEVRDGSCNRDRIKVIKALAAEPEQEFTMYQLSGKLRLGNKTINRHLCILWNLKLIDRTLVEFENGRAKYRWKANKKHTVTKIIMNELQEQEEKKKKSQS